MKQLLRDLADKLDCRLIGDGSIMVTQLSSLQSADAESLVFVDDAKYLDAALASSAAAVIAGEFAANPEALAASAPARKPLLISSQPRLAFARAARLLGDAAAQGRGIHPSAIVAASVIGGNVDIGPRAIVGEQVKIGEGTTIGAGCVIGDGVEIGAHCRIDANVTIYSGTTLWSRVVV